LSAPVVDDDPGDEGLWSLLVEDDIYDADVAASLGEAETPNR